MTRPLVALLAALSLVTCGGSKSPAAPSTPDTPTRIISILGAPLDFGDVEIGGEATRAIQIVNSGNSPLTVTSLSGQFAGAFAASWTSGVIPPGLGQNVDVRFRPTEVRSYNATLTVNGDQTSGTNTRTITARGVFTGPLWTASGHGNTVLDVPSYVTRVQVHGRWDGLSNSNFIVRYVGGLSFINEILRESLVYDGVHNLTGHTIEIVSSGNIDWTFTEVRQ